MKWSAIIFLLMPGLLICSCSQGKKGNVILSGRIADAGGQKLLLQDLDMQFSKTVDSVTLDPEGNYSFNIRLKEPGLYLLSLPKLQPLVLELKPGDSIGISSVSTSFPSGARLTGSADSRDLLEFFNTTNSNRKIYDSLENVLLVHQDEPGFAILTNKLDESLKPLWEKQRELEINYIERHLNSLTSLLILNQGLGVSPVLTFKNDSVYFLKLDSSLNKAFPGNKHVVFHIKRIIQEREVETMKQRSK